MRERRRLTKAGCRCFAVCRPQICELQRPNLAFIFGYTCTLFIHSYRLYTSGSLPSSYFFENWPLTFKPLRNASLSSACQPLDESLINTRTVIVLNNDIQLASSASYSHYWYTHFFISCLTWKDHVQRKKRLIWIGYNLRADIFFLM